VNSRDTSAANDTSNSMRPPRLSEAMLAVRLTTPVAMAYIPLDWRSGC